MSLKEDSSLCIAAYGAGLQCASCTGKDGTGALTVMETAVVAVVCAMNEAWKALLSHPLLLLLIGWAMDGVSASR